MTDQTNPEANALMVLRFNAFSRKLDDGYLYWNHGAKDRPMRAGHCFAFLAKYPAIRCEAEYV